jgi:deferrochelatase/peroxidase EfeB
VESQTGGDILLLITSDDEQVTFHAARNLIRIAKGAFRVRHMQAGFLPPEGQSAGTARNLFGFKDGTANYSPKDSALAEEHLLVKPEDEPKALWLAGGTFAAFRQFKMAIETWDRSSLAEQEQIFGRSKLTGAPLHVSNPKDSDEFESMNLNNAAIDKNSHVALAHPDSNGGVRILRRAFNYANGLDEVGHLDAGLLFFSFQRSIEKQFAPMQTRLAANDLMNEYVAATGSAYFAIPRAPEQASHWGAEFA